LFLISSLGLVDAEFNGPAESHVAEAVKSKSGDGCDVLANDKAKAKMNLPPVTVCLNLFLSRDIRQSDQTHAGACFPL
jgi:hypothetical protein